VYRSAQKENGNLERIDFKSAVRNINKNKEIKIRRK
jgi:hypothetical protein